MYSFEWTWLAPLIACPAAILAGALELGLRWRHSPTSSRRFTRAYVLALVWEATWAFAILAGLQSVDQFHTASWLWSPFGWFVTGLMSSLVVRGNLFEVGLGDAKVGIGFGVLYLPVRSLLDRIFADEGYMISRRRNHERLLYYTRRAGNMPDALGSLIDGYENYLVTIDRRQGSLQEPEWSTDAARAYIRVCRQNTNVDAAVSQLLEYAITREHLTPLEECMGRPSSKAVRKSVRLALDVREGAPPS